VREIRPLGPLKRLLATEIPVRECEGRKWTEGLHVAITKNHIGGRDISRLRMCKSFLTIDSLTDTYIPGRGDRKESGNEVGENQGAKKRRVKRYR